MLDSAATPQAQRIALFGGSFDPPHLGHVFAAVHARAVGQVDAVWVLPVAHHPYGKALQPWAQRWALTCAAFADLPFVSVRDDEQHNPQGHTVTLIEQLSARYPQHQWLLVGGSDTYADLINWYRGSELQDLVAVHPVPRRGFDHHNPAALPELSSSLIRERLRQGQTVAGLIPASVQRMIDEAGWYRAA